MSGAWLVSYLILWGLVVVLAFLVFGCLQQLGILQRRTEGHSVNTDDSVPTLEKDGPTIGSPLPDIVAESMNGFGKLISSSEKGTLLMFMSPLCESCQHVVDPLNTLVEKQEYSGQVIVILRADEQGCRAFQSIFPLQVPVICDSSREITMSFDVHSNPFGLLYNANGVLARKGKIVDADDLRALLGEAPASPRARTHIFPPPGTFDEPIAAEV